MRSRLIVDILICFIHGVVNSTEIALFCLDLSVSYLIRACLSYPIKITLAILFDGNLITPVKEQVNPHYIVVLLVNIANSSYHISSNEN